MILLDTHIWHWWVDDPAKLSATQMKHVKDNEPFGLGVSVMSCWEIAKGCAVGRIKVLPDVSVWIRRALAYPGIRLIDLSLDIVIDANQLPGPFHRDPIDQLLVATARVLSIAMLTADGKILAYPHVTLLK
jgi:PIN domain nuclease of toxin-antitoxin system